MIYNPLTDLFKMLADPGHAECWERHGYGGFKESVNNLALAKEIKAYGESTYNMQIDLTRTTKNPLDKSSEGNDLTARARKSKGYHLLYSVHSDAAGPGASGATAYGDINPKNADHNLFTGLVKAVSRATGFADNGVRYRSLTGDWVVKRYPTAGHSNYYAVLRNGQAQIQVLMEHGFHTHPKESKVLAQKETHKRIAKEVIDCIASYYRIPKKVKEPLKQTSGKMTKDQYILWDKREVVDEAATLAWIETKVKKPKLTCSLKDLVSAFYTEGKKENVRPDLALCQAAKETGWWQYGGIVLPEQNNFGGLAAFNNNTKGDAASFKDCKEGARASVQHLRGYATKDKPAQKIVDPRYQALIDKKYLGMADTFHKLSGKWAWPGYNNKQYGSYEDAYRVGETYGQDITRLYDELVAFAKSYKQPVAKDKEPEEEPTHVGVFAEASADIGGAMRILSQVPGAVLVDVSRLNPKFYKKVVQIGGSKKHAKATDHVSGKNRYDTDKEVTKWINQNI